MVGGVDTSVAIVGVQLPETVPLTNEAVVGTKVVLSEVTLMLQVTACTEPHVMSMAVSDNNLNKKRFIELLQNI